MTRRILAAVAAAIAIVTLLPDRVSGDPTSTSTSASTSTTLPVAARIRQFERAFGVSGFRGPDPLRLYPGRPGAKYEDIESRPDHAVALGIASLRTGDVYLYVGTVPPPYFVVFDPDVHVADSTSTARGVWEVSERDLSAAAARTSRSAPRPTPG